MKTLIAAVFATFLFATPSHALFSPVTNSRIETSAWNVQYIGETEVDGVRVAALLENMTQEIQIPELSLSRSVLPTAASTDKKQAWRLTLVSIEQPELRASFALKRDTAFVDGSPMKVFFSQNASASGFSFVIQGKQDGSLQVQFNREVGNGDSANGEFQMVPAVQVM